MGLAPTTEIDPEACDGCEMCVKVCPDETLTMRDGKAVVTGETSMHCDHCAAICPTGAVVVRSLEEDQLRLATVENRDSWIKYGDFDSAGLVQLMRSRRSSRMFLDKPVPREVLEDLVKIGITAPSGTNCQLWTFTIVPDRQAVIEYAQAIAGFFRKLNKMAESRLARVISRVFMKDQLGEYYREYYHKVVQALEEWEQTGRERLFHGAPAVIVVGMQPGATCPCEDALLASQNILLAAHSMGYGTCLIGFAVEAMRHDPKIKKLLGIPREERVYAVIAVGKTRELYKRLAGRKKFELRYWDGKQTTGR